MTMPPDEAAAAGAASTAQAATRQAQQIADIGDLTPKEHDQLEQLGVAVDRQVAERIAALTQRHVGQMLVLALTVIALTTMIVMAIVSTTSSEANYKEFIGSIQPGTIIVACIAALGGIAAGVNLKEK